MTRTNEDLRRVASITLKAVDRTIDTLGRSDITLGI